MLLAAIELPCNKELALWLAAGIFSCSTLLMAVTRPQVQLQQRNLDAVLRLSNLVVLGVCIAKQQEMQEAEFEGFSSDETVRVILSGNQEAKGHGEKRL